MLNYSYKLFKLIIIFTSVITGWTLILLFSNTAYKTEIKDLINKMYLNQKNFIFNIKDLSVLLLKDTNERFPLNPQDKFEKRQEIK